MLNKVSNYEKQIEFGRRIFLSYDQNQMISRFGLAHDDHYIFGDYLGSRFRLERATGVLEMDSGEGFTLCREYTTVMTIYEFLCYAISNGAIGERSSAASDGILQADSSDMNGIDCSFALSGKWIPVENFSVTGCSPESNYFVQKYANAFSGHVEEFTKACLELGGEKQKPLAGADVTVIIPTFLKFPVLLQFWEKDEEFAPQIKLLWDRNTTRYIRFETTFYLQGDLLKKLQACQNAKNIGINTQ